MKYSYVEMKEKGRCLLLTVYFFSGMLYTWIMQTADDVHVILFCQNSYYFKLLLVLYRNHSVQSVTLLSQCSILNTRYLISSVLMR